METAYVISCKIKDGRPGHDYYVGYETNPITFVLADARKFATKHEAEFALMSVDVDWPEDLPWHYPKTFKIVKDEEWRLDDDRVHALGVKEFMRSVKGLSDPK